MNRYKHIVFDVDGAIRRYLEILEICEYAKD